MVAFTLVVTAIQCMIDRLRGFNSRSRGYDGDDDDDDDDEHGNAFGMLFRNGMLRRELTPADYETLLRLDNSNFNEESEGADHGLPQEYIDRCPVMVATQNQIDNMTQGVTKACEGEGEREGEGGHKDYACTVCLADYEPGDHIRTLPCMHNYHTECIDPWLRDRGDCPICKLRLDDMT
jgi:E3 ubiquitin-protein ligase SDIR1